MRKQKAIFTYKVGMKEKTSEIDVRPTQTLHSIFRQVKFETFAKEHKVGDKYPRLRRPHSFVLKDRYDVN